MFNKMISHFASEKPRALHTRKSDNGGLNSGYVRMLSRTYADVYGR